MKFFRLIKWPVAAFTVAALSFALISLTSAKTTVAPTPNEKCSFTVTVQIAYAFLDEGSQNKADDLIKLWKESMDKVWNGPNGQTTGDCKCKVKFVFDIVKLDKGKDCRQAPAGYHCFNVVDRAVNQRGNRADAHEVPPDGSMNGYGEWTTSANGLDAAHEAGHLMGLADEYRYDDTDGDGQKDDHVNLKPVLNPDGSRADQQGIMAETWGNVGPTQANIDEIIKDSGQSCPPECCCGNGVVDDNKTVKEECDPKANPNGCEGDQECTEQCMCIGGLVTPKCGDKRIQAPEECDDAAMPQGCKENEICVDCICFGPEPAPPPATPAPKHEDEPAPPPEPAAPTTPAPTTPTPTTPAPSQPTPTTPTPGSGSTAACSTDAECDDGDPCSVNKCMNPGRADAYCTKTWYTGCSGGDGCCPSNCSAGNDSDCPAACGDGHCSPGEDCASCPGDCGECGPACGDGVCHPDEGCETCPLDCGACGPVCGDGLCFPEEECVCLADCPVCALPECTDGKDNDGDGLIDMEDPGCLHPLDEAEYDDWCGNGICEPEFGEDPATCQADCQL